MSSANTSNAGAPSVWAGISATLLIYRILLVCALLSVPLLFSAFAGFQGDDLNIMTRPVHTTERRLIGLEVSLGDIDPVGQTMDLSWAIAYDTCATPLMNSTQIWNTSLCTSVNIFVDQNLLATPTSDDVPTNDSPTTPIFRFNASEYYRTSLTSANSSAFDNLATFKTSLALINRYLSSIGYKRMSLQYYPFDEYYAITFMFARDAQTSEAIRLRIGNSNGAVVGYNTQAVDYSLGDVVPTIDVGITITRSVMVKAYVLIIVIGIWIITLILLFVAVDSAFFGMPRPLEVLVIPVATLFASTQLRATFPGAPNFGCQIDFVGILPCLVLMVFSAALTMVTAAVFSINAEREQRDTLLTTFIRRNQGRRCSFNFRVGKLKRVKNVLSLC